ncbi:acetyl-CoA carboxylase biotin carboxyl carrier protein [Streptococcus sp. CP1998]|uniref:Biotin carboxyl carrier protein of acetyl-CoA carboxylase n=1 Tax=Streptococcus sp. CP1998 TaxID=3238303 RepID=A0AB39LC23_9STRE
MNISEIKDLLAQFDASTLREFSYKNNGEELNLSKNQTSSVAATPVAPAVEVVATPQTPVVAPVVEAPATPAVAAEPVRSSSGAEGDVVESPLVGVAYLSPAPDKSAFVSVGDKVTKGQTLLIIEAMKVMNEVPAPKDGVVTEILVTNEEMVEFGKGLVRIK